MYACMPRRVEQEFVQFCVANPVMLKPVLDMQYSLRRATFGMCRAQVPPFHTRAMQRISALACLGLAPTSGVRYWTAVMHKRYGKTTERDPMRRAIESAMAMTAKQRDAAVGEVSLAVCVFHAAPCTALPACARCLLRLRVMVGHPLFAIDLCSCSRSWTMRVTGLCQRVATC